MWYILFRTQEVTTEMEGSDLLKSLRKYHTQRREEQKVIERRLQKYVKRNNTQQHKEKSEKDGNNV